MNIRYKIDKETIIVTDENGKKRMIPKYKHIEEILKLENEIKVIDELIENSRNVKNSNYTKVMDKKRNKINFMAFCGVELGIIGVGVNYIFKSQLLAIPIINNVSIGVVGTILFSTIGLISLPIAFATAAINLCRLDKIILLQNRIKLLTNIRYTKKHQVETMKSLISNDVESEETLVPVRQLTKSERLKEISNWIKESYPWSGEIAIDEINGALKTIQKTTKQKVLQMR